LQLWREIHCARRDSSRSLLVDAKKIEDLPSDGGHVVDVLAGAYLRIFCRLKQLETAYDDLRARLTAIEDGARPAAAPVRAETKRATYDGRPDTRGSSAASRFAVRQAGRLRTRCGAG
jgi:hypothetical protein